MKRTTLAILLVAFLCFGYLTTAGQSAPAPKDSPTLKWEYKTLALHVYDLKFEKELNAMGDEGWECIGVVGEQGTGSTAKKVFLFKRLKK